MPVLETPKVLYRESREAELIGIRELLDEHRDLVLTVRIGATEFIYLNEWDEPCLIASTPASIAMLRRLAEVGRSQAA